MRGAAGVCAVLGLVVGSACAGGDGPGATGWASAANDACETFAAQHEGDDAAAVSTSDVAGLLRSLTSLEGATDADVAPLAQELGLLAESLDGDGEVGLSGLQTVVALGAAGADDCQAVFSRPIEGAEVAAIRETLAGCDVQGTDDYRGGLLRLRLSLIGEPAGPEAYSSEVLGMVGLDRSSDDDAIWTLTVDTDPDAATVGERACTLLDLVDPSGVGTYGVIVGP